MCCPSSVPCSPPLSALHREGEDGQWDAGRLASSAPPITEEGRKGRPAFRR